jgi:N-acylglucosamine 2-epimerase
MDTAAIRAEWGRLLLEGLVPFWFRHGVDAQHGGVLSCMTEEGEVQSGNKYLWSQGRWLWLVSALCNRVERRPEWLEAASRTAGFLMDHGRDDQGRWWFALTREGRPLEPPTSIFSDCFAIYGLSEYYRAEPDPRALDVALKSYRRVVRRVEEPDFVEFAPERPRTGRRLHSIPMILLEVASELAQTTGDARIEADADEYARRILEHHIRPDRRVLLEYLDRDYRPLPPPEGTAVEPGHAIESMWFLIHWARRRRRADVERTASDVIRWHLEKGWDPVHGGLFLAIDADGGPPFIANADKKIWWPHTEALYATALIGDWEWYRRIHEWSFRHFPLAGPLSEWRQRLDRTGLPITDLIALPVKDPFHLPRAALLIGRTT